MLPEFWQKISFFNPVVYLISGFRWSFYGSSDVGIEISLIAIVIFASLCMFVIYRIFKTGYRIKQ
jgi:ABC-2 type transport system permease protein